MRTSEKRTTVERADQKPAVASSPTMSLGRDDDAEPQARPDDELRMDLAVRDRLLPCAHCGKPDPRRVPAGYGPNRTIDIECERCGAVVPETYWNKRVDKAKPTVSQQLVNDAKAAT